MALFDLCFSKFPVKAIVLTSTLLPCLLYANGDSKYLLDAEKAIETVETHLFNYNVAKNLALSELFSSQQHYRLMMSNQELLSNAITEDKVNKLLHQIKKYHALTNYLWPNLQETELTLGRKSPEIAKLRWMLVSLEDLYQQPLSSYREQVVDPSILTGLKHFQARHGLSTTGKLTRETVNLLNISPATTTLALVELLTNQLLSPITRTKEYIEINIPNYQLRLINDNQVVMNLKVIVGKTTTATPILSTSISKLTLNPSWTVPASIIEDEILLRVAHDEYYLSRNKFVLKGLDNKEDKSYGVGSVTHQFLKDSLKTKKLVQQPSVNNALGKYRFTIPNGYSIFIHDTPSKNLFNLKNRSLSHGCIRLQHPGKLARYLIDREASVVKKQFSYAVKKDETVHFILNNPIPVYVTYNTMWIDEDGILQFRPDIYSQKESY